MIAEFSRCHVNDTNRLSMCVWRDPLQSLKMYLFSTKIHRHHGSQVPHFPDNVHDSQCTRLTSPDNKFGCKIAPAYVPCFLRDPTIKADFFDPTEIIYLHIVGILVGSIS